MNVLIADDEEIVRQGLHCIINWPSLGFTVCGEAGTGNEALEKILSLKPDLVLMDIRMPGLTGIEVVEEARRRHFGGQFIILSGVSDFKYAQTAIRCGVKYYLTKPIDEDELEKAVVTIRDAIDEERRSADALNQYRVKAKDAILRDVLLGRADFAALDTDDLGLTANVYQVVLYESYDPVEPQDGQRLVDALSVTSPGRPPLEHVQIAEKDLILLKGGASVQRLQSMLERYAPRRDSPLDSLFLACGRQVSRLEDVPLSMRDVTALERRRFFCEPEQHVLESGELPATERLRPVVSDEEVSRWQKLFSGYIQAHNRAQTVTALKSLEETLFLSSDSQLGIQHFLADIYFQVKLDVARAYPTVDIPFPSNATVLGLIEGKRYLYEIVQFFSEQFEIWFNAVGTSSDNVVDDLLNYIERNFRDNLRLETLAPLFGYNSSYLGKLFSKKTGDTFNTYVDKVRIRHAVEQLKSSDAKVYEIAEQSGYCNVDYFHKKFRKYVGMSPAEYRRLNCPGTKSGE